MENKEENRPETTEAGQGSSGKQMPYTVDYCPRKPLNLKSLYNTTKIVLSLLNSVNTPPATPNARLGFKNIILNT